MLANDDGFGHRRSAARSIALRNPYRVATFPIEDMRDPSAACSLTVSEAPARLASKWSAPGTGRNPELGAFARPHCGRYERSQPHPAGACNSRHLFSLPRGERQPAHLGAPRGKKDWSSQKAKVTRLPSGAIRATRLAECGHPNRATKPCQLVTRDKARRSNSAGALTQREGVQRPA